MRYIKRLLQRDIFDAYAFILPAALFAALFVIVPVAFTFVSSLFRDVTFLPREFIGFGNFIALSGDAHFWQSTVFTLIFVVVSVAIELALGLAFAVILNEQKRWRGLFMIMILLPWVIPIAISARIWELLYMYDFGLINFLLLEAGIVDGPVNWLGSEWGAFWSIVIADVWRTTPFMTIIILAGLSSIPEDLYRQARIDGASFLQRFVRITLPLLKPALVVALLFRTIDAIRIFDLIYVLTRGGPGGSTESLTVFAFNYYLSGGFGYGSAVSVVVFILAFVLSIVYIKAGKFREAME